MALDFVLDFDPSAWKVTERKLTEIMSKAGGDAARTMRAESSRRVRSRKQFKQKWVLEKMPIEFPSSKTAQRLAWKMTVSGMLMPVSAFVHKQTSTGVTFSVNVGKRSVIPGAFTAQMKSGRYGVWVRRKGVYGRNGNPGLERIREAYTTRLTDVFADGDFIPFVHRATQDRFRSSFLRLMNAEYQKLPLGGGGRV